MVQPNPTSRENQLHPLTGDEEEAAVQLLEEDHTLQKKKRSQLTAAVLI